ncbi:hypothetical protein JCGZ_19221 [Jatropha curcas]|uniref:Uncharacterized protein n=1 Tax=Jatropha curcas TaxID=180498 RepID=A0A067K366_JATCU|nr:uncharacterized protein At4g26450 isoform X1 [Jatropha curcas]XP_012081850.1 uncharacterized protein At4g26450 isoform X1 [Jatropha curcas]XP_037494019.1 uncharacterized protein At4g26450 isoform X1 [Jatropha curcas]KDP29508.1 hypothetical protein JCGZ_19221 [Jatropha curcas]
MHARHRSPGNGFRSNSMGMGLGTSRISPENSARGRGFYNSEYRSFNNRGFGRGQGQHKSFQQPSQPPPRKGDILMEAGRLAAEYLVSKGLLPQSALSGKWQNGSLKKQVSDYQDLRLQEDLTQEGRTSAHARVGSGSSDEGAGRRKYSDDFSLKNHVRGRRRGEYYNRSYSSEREYGRSGCMSDTNRVSPDMEGGDDAVSGHYEERQVGGDVGDGMQKSVQSGSAPESEEATDMESGAEFNNSDEMGSKPSSFSVKDKTDGEPIKASDGLTNLNVGIEETKDSNDDQETEKQIVPDGSTIEHSAVEGDLSGKRGSDLLTFCKFAKIPTKTRSALTYRGPKIDQVLKKEEENTSGIVPSKGSEVSIEYGSLDFSAADVLPNTTHDPKYSDPEISKAVPAQSAEDAGELDPAYGSDHGKCMRSQSFPDRAFMHNTEQEPSQGVPGFGRSTSVKERGEKRTAEDNSVNEATKKPREWLPSLVGIAGDHLHLSNLIQNQDSLQDGRTSSDQHAIVADTQASLVNSHQVAKPGGEACVDYSQEKQLFPSSFKICDLNLMEASDINDNHCNDPVLVYRSIAAKKKEAEQIDVDLSMSNSNLSGEYPRSTENGKNIEVIDLENEEDNAFDNSQRKEIPFTGTEGFPNNAQNAEDIADVPDSYDSLTISEFLTTFSNCASVSEDINPLQNEMGLHNGEGTLGDDDSIYMSLGEIPLSFIPAWEQQTPQEYGKPF